MDGVMKISVSLPLALAVALASAVAPALMSSTRALSMAGDRDHQSFEVASVKPNTSGNPYSPMQVAPGGRLRATNFPLDRLIRWAYRLQDFQLAGGPGLTTPRMR